VNAVAPQLLDTAANRATFPAEAMAHTVAPEAIAGVIAFLVSEAAAPVSGAILPATAHKELSNLRSHRRPKSGKGKSGGRCTVGASGRHG
jgi:NAD(P)-dependent dehydrogenase (short-subunit alcohol dehydrogenase family)